MSPRLVRILVASSRPEVAERVRRELSDATLTASFRIGVAVTSVDVLRSIDVDPPDVVILDGRLAEDRSVSFARSLKEREISVPVILLVEPAEEPGPAEAARAGIVECVPLDALSSRSLVSCIRYAVDRNRTDRTRRDSEEALRRAEQELRDVVRHAGVMTCRHDMSGTILAISDAAAGALGYSPGELLGVSIRDILAPGRRPEFDEYLDRIRSDGAATGYMAIVARSGEIRYWHYQNRLAPDPASPLVNGMAIDVTERLRAEGAAANFAQRQAAILDALPAQVALLDEKGTILEVNEDWNRFARENGGDPRQVGKGINYLSVCEESGSLSAIHGKTVAEGIRAVLKGERERFSTEYDCDTPDQRRWFRVTVTPVLRGRIRGAVVMHVDRTEQRTVEERLRGQAMIFENMHDAVMIADRAGIIIDLNRSAEKMYGLPREEALGRSVAILAPTAEEQEKTRAMGAAALLGESWEGERPFRRPDGSPGLREVLVLPLRDSAGEAVGTAGISRDVTVDRAAAEALRASEEKYRDVVDLSPMGFYRSSRDGRFLAANPAFAQMMGYDSVDDLLANATALQLYRDAAERERVIAHHSGRDRSELDLHARRKDGSEMRLHLTARIVLEESGVPEAFEGFVSDVTAERRAQRELEERTKELEALVSKNPLGIVVLDAHHRAQTVNPAFEKLFGYSSEDVVGRDIDSLISPEGSEFDTSALTARVLAGETIHLTRVRRRKDESLVDVEIHGVPLIDHGTLLGVYAIYEDISERRRAEEALRDSALHLDAIINAVADPIFVKDRAHRWTLVNDAFCSLIGQGCEALLGKSDADFFPDAQVREALARDEAIFETGAPSVNEESITDAEGRERSLVTKKAFHRDKSGNEFIVGVIRDVTERKAAEVSLRRSEARYRLLFERNLAGVYRSALDGRILECNEAFARILGYSVEELGRKNAKDFYFYEIDRAALVERLGETRQVTDGEFCLRRKDGSPAWVIENVTLVEDPQEGAFLEGSLVDISARRDVEEALRESEERYRFLFERNPLPMWVYEVDSLKFIDVNLAAILHYGYSRSEFLSMGLADIRPPEDREKMLRDVAKTATIPQTFRPSRHLRRDGTVIFTEVSAVDLPGGPVRRRMALARDVTERLRAEAALQTSEEKYRKIVDFAPVGIYQSMLDGRLTTCNDAFARVFGYASAEEMIAMRSTVPLFEASEERDASIARHLPVGRAGNAELHLARKDGGRVWVQNTAQIVRDAQGNVDRVEGFVIDVSERKRIEEQQSRLQAAVLETARQWRDTFDAIATPVLIVDSQGIIKRLNRAAVELAGRTYLEVLGRTLAEIEPAEPWQRAELLIREMGKKETLPGTLCRDDTTGRTWELSVSRFENPRPENPLFILVARDITTLVELQESVMRSESMSAMGALVAGVAHEVRNPLFAISATLDAFDLRFRDREEYRRYATALRSQLDRMNDLMNGLLDLGKPAIYDFRDVSLEDIVAEAVRSCREQASRRNVLLEASIPPEHPHVRVDRMRTVQVFVNLIENAVQHAPAGTTVRISAANGVPEGLVSCVVEDSGPGFRPEDLPRVFEPFFTRRQGGTGLGLAIVRRLVSEQGGDIVPENRPEGGARLTVTLPGCAAPGGSGIAKKGVA